MVAVAVAATGALWVILDAQPHVVRAGDATVLVDKKYFGLHGVAGVASGGELVLTNGCVTLTWQDAAAPTLLVWPHGTTIAGVDEGLSFELGGKAARIGDYVELGVEESTPEWVQERFDDQVPTDCASLSPLFIDSLDTVTGK
jgi:hypothetical protein